MLIKLEIYNSVCKVPEEKKVEVPITTEKQEEKREEKKVVEQEAPKPVKDERIVLDKEKNKNKEKEKKKGCC